MARRARGIRINATERIWLEKRVRSRLTPQGLAFRCRIVRQLADGFAVRKVGWTVRPSRRTVELWRERFEKDGPRGLWQDKPGRGRKPGHHDR